MELQPSISIVCATFNGGQKLPGLLNSLNSNLGISKVNCEVIFVLDGSTDNSLEQLQSFAKLNSNKIIRVIQNQTNLGISESRNVGIAASTSSIIAFLDDDCRPDPNWLNSLLDCWQHSSSEIMGVGGYVIPSEINSFNQKFCARFSPLRPVAMDFETLNVGARLMKYYAKSVQTNMFAEYLVGANMSFRKSALSKVGFFPAEIRFGGDDSYICRLMRAEYGDRCLSVLDTLEMKHEFPKSFKDSLRRSYRYGNGSGKNFSRGNGSFSFNPGPILILSFLLLFLTCHLILGASIRDALSRSLVFFPLEILFYAFFVTRDKSALPRFFIQRIKLGLAFLVSETANSVGFISGLRFPFGDYREYS